MIYRESVTHQQAWILDYLEGRDWTSPTEIGKASPLTANMYGSPWASPKCLRLVSMGLLERNSEGHYRLRAEEVEGMSERRRVVLTRASDGSNLTVVTKVEHQDYTHAEDQALALMHALHDCCPSWLWEKLTNAWWQVNEQFEREMRERERKALEDS